MRPGKASQTALLVCVGRAIADRRKGEGRFSDPVAEKLLPDEWKSRVDWIVSGRAPKGLRQRFGWYRLSRLAQMMIPRTVEIDDAVRSARSQQVVILGAGFDGRAWRMPELADSVVFEVDHPDSQREKRAQTESLKPLAREVRFVPVDFTKDKLGDALSAAGHDPAKSTTWIWEGVVMYLDLPAIESTLDVIASSSSPKSQVVIAYHSPALRLLLLGFLLRRIGEPLKSALSPGAMAALLEKHSFRAARDVTLKEVGASLAPATADGVRGHSHFRIVTAVRK